MRIKEKREDVCRVRQTNKKQQKKMPPLRLIQDGTLLPPFFVCKEPGTGLCKKPPPRMALFSQLILTKLWNCVLI
jgi:hypothetical protein